jgi:hypothetical protein
MNVENKKLEFDDKLNESQERLQEMEVERSRKVGPLPPHNYTYTHTHTHTHTHFQSTGPDHSHSHALTPHTLSSSSSASSFSPSSTSSSSSSLRHLYRPKNGRREKVQRLHADGLSRVSALPEIRRWRRSKSPVKRQLPRERHAKRECDNRCLA